LLPAVLPGTTLARMHERWAATEEGGERLSGRGGIWGGGVAVVAGRAPPGAGLAGFPDAFFEDMLGKPVHPPVRRNHSRGNRAAHNLYVCTFAELGLAGGALLVIALAAHGRRLRQLRRAAAEVGHKQAEDVTLALLAVLATMLVAGLNEDVLLSKTPWLLLGAMQGASIAAGRGGGGGGRARGPRPAPPSPPRPAGNPPLAPPPRPPPPAGLRGG